MMNARGSRAGWCYRPILLWPPGIVNTNPVLSTKSTHLPLHLAQICAIVMLALRIASNPPQAPGDISKDPGHGDSGSVRRDGNRRRPAPPPGDDGHHEALSRRSGAR